MNTIPFQACAGTLSSSVSEALSLLGEGWTMHDEEDVVSYEREDPSLCVSLRPDDCGVWLGGFFFPMPSPLAAAQGSLLLWAVDAISRGKVEPETMGPYPPLTRSANTDLGLGVDLVASGLHKAYEAV